MSALRAWTIYLAIRLAGGSAVLPTGGNPIVQAPQSCISSPA